ncbi:MAG: BamA/TamA family outer membrane protein [Granulosicoccaceae bacterium]
MRFTVRQFCVSWLFPGLLAVAFCAEGLAADAIPGEQYCDRPVSKIVFHGNDTKRRVLLREVFQKEGAVCSLDYVVDSVQSVLNLGLFRSVVAEFKLNEEKLELHFTVREKFALLVIPRFSRTSDAELRAGIQVRWDNVAGRLHQMKITSETRRADDGDGNEGFVHRFSYNVPRFFGSDFGMGVSFAVRRQQTDFRQDGVAYGTGYDKSRVLDVTMSRWAANTDGVAGLRYFGGLQVAASDLSLTDGESGPFIGGDDISVVFGFENTQKQVNRYRRQGEVYGASLRLANSETHSDFSYVRLDGFWRFYRALPGASNNLNIQLRLGLSDGAPFGRRAFSVGGGEILRGLPPGSSTGDILTLANVEYLSAFAGREYWRWVLFADIGNVYNRDRVKLHRQKVRAGLGLRRKIESLSNTDLRLDFAWDTDAKRFRSFFSTHLTF